MISDALPLFRYCVVGDTQEVCAVGIVDDTSNIECATWCRHSGVGALGIHAQWQGSTAGVFECVGCVNPLAIFGGAPRIVLLAGQVQISKYNVRRYVGCRQRADGALYGRSVCSACLGLEIVRKLVGRYAVDGVVARRMCA